MCNFFLEENGAVNQLNTQTASPPGTLPGSPQPRPPPAQRESLFTRHLTLVSLTPLLLTRLPFTLKIHQQNTLLTKNKQGVQQCTWEFSNSRIIPVSGCKYT